MAFALEWYPRYSQLFMTDTAGWSCEAVGAFDRLLDFAWVNGGVENDEEVMARICGLERKAFAGLRVKPVAANLERKTLADHFLTLAP